MIPSESPFTLLGPTLPPKLLGVKLLNLVWVFSRKTHAKRERLRIDLSYFLVFKIIAQWDGSAIYEDIDKLTHSYQIISREKQKEGSTTSGRIFSQQPLEHTRAELMGWRKWLTLPVIRGTVWWVDLFIVFCSLARFWEPMEQKIWRLPSSIWPSLKSWIWWVDL